jgi:hypothetical protein
MFSFEDLVEIRNRMKAKGWWVQIEGADHGIKFEMEKRRSVCEFVGKIAGIWLRDYMSVLGKSERTVDVLVGWDESKNEFRTISSEVCSSQNGYWLLLPRFISILSYSRSLRQEICHIKLLF